MGWGSEYEEGEEMADENEGHLASLIRQSIDATKETGQKVDRLGEKVGTLDREIGSQGAGLKAQGESLQRAWQKIESLEMAAKEAEGSAAKENETRNDRITKLEERTVTKNGLYVALSALAGTMLLGLPPLIDLVHNLLHPGGH